MTITELDKLVKEGRKMTDDQAQALVHELYKTSEEARIARNLLGNIGIATVFESHADGSESFSIRKGKLPEKTDWKGTRFYHLAVNNAYAQDREKLIKLSAFYHSDLALTIDSLFGSIILDGWSDV